MTSQTAAVPPEPPGRGVDVRLVRVGLALSGGGFRAAAFHLGVLKRLEEIRLLHRVEALSCVSGGSITGGLYALRCAQRGGAPGSYPVEDLIKELMPLLTTNLRGRALFGSPVKAARTACSFLFQKVTRVGLVVYELDRQLFNGATLVDLPPWILLNATNLRTGRAWKFYRDRAGDFLVGATERTSYIGVAEAVVASAAYPGLLDAYRFATRWDDLRGDVLAEEYWERPPQPRPGAVSRWRERFGQTTGPVMFPLADGGLYDNEGLNGLRGRRVTHAILSGVAPPESDAPSATGVRGLLRVIDVVHDRLGGTTRQLAHEMTHGVAPANALLEAEALACDVRALARGDGMTSLLQTRLEELAARVDRLASVGRPPRGHQFTASAQLLLHRTDLALNAFAGRPGGIDVPAEFRGVDAALVAELSRVRTDLDALPEGVVNLLIAQGYFLADFYVQLMMPDLTLEGGTSWYLGPRAPRWAFAHDTVANANANLASVTEELSTAGRRCGIVGRTPALGTRWRYRGSLLIVLVGAAAAALAALMLLDWGLHAVLQYFRAPLQ